MSQAFPQTMSQMYEETILLEFRSADIVGEHRHLPLGDVEQALRKKRKANGFGASNMSDCCSDDGMFYKGNRVHTRDGSHAMSSPFKPGARPSGRPLPGSLVQLRTVAEREPRWETCLIQPSEQAANRASPPPSPPRAEEEEDDDEDTDSDTGARSSGCGSSPSPTRSNSICSFSAFGHALFGNGSGSSVGHGSMRDALLTMLCHVSAAKSATAPQNTTATPPPPAPLLAILCC